jgi:cell division protease FtsH
MSLEQMTSRLAIMMGGRVAEELIFGRNKVTSGASSDIEQATRLARMMVTRWGLSEELGTVAYGENNDEVFLGMQVNRQQNVSEATAQKIDSEVRRLVEEGYVEATRILTEKRDDLETLAKGLLEFETLSGDEIADLLNGKKPNRSRCWSRPARAPRRFRPPASRVRARTPGLSRSRRRDADKQSEKGRSFDRPFLVSPQFACAGTTRGCLTICGKRRPAPQPRGLTLPRIPRTHANSCG